MIDRRLPKFLDNASFLLGMGISKERNGEGADGGDGFQRLPDP